MKLRNGHLTIGPRPGKRTLRRIEAEGFTHVVTILRDTEGAHDIAAAIESMGLEWIWIPLGKARPEEADRIKEQIAAALDRIIDLLGDPESKIYLHCSAGLHRTGMITCALLRQMGHAQEEALALLERLRPKTREAVGEHRLAWANRFVAYSVLTSTNG